MKLIHIGTLIRRKRLKKGLTCDQLSLRCRLAAGYLYMIETGRHHPIPENVERIAHGLKVPAWTLLRLVKS